MAHTPSQLPKSPTTLVSQPFLSTRSWWLKILGAGAVGVVISCRAFIGQRWNDATPFQRIGMFVATPLVAMVIAGVLLRADLARRRLRAGEPVSWITRLFFGYGIWSLLIWVVVLLLVGFPLAIILGNLTADRPAG
ncbi:MAG: hypothetical protein ACYC4U_25065 [Pirellulaceae bacterium]